ncbi:hypothetical protein CBER1_06040 [Cercospora berteroae]|uniref:Uncharacterized protein n=1 Tax=Cercospora berteroae TaxID=357750 RepID=A0A2S6C593_9PEZI|nr:hypothetical protein CBER1_06040 [Cercospora berteroae]
MSNPTTTSSPAAMAPPEGVCHFEKLPPEVLGIICSFAYGCQSTRCITTRLQLEESREHLVKQGTVASLPPFKHYVDHFLVSKRFFLSATEAFIKAQRLDQTKQPFHTRNARLCAQRTVQLFARSLKVKTFTDVSLLGKFLNLRTVETVIDDSHFEKGLRCKKYPWLHVFQNHELADLDLVKDLVVLRGLTTFTCEASKCYYADTEPKRQMWQENVLTLQRYLAPIVTAPKPKSTSTSSCNNSESMPLYPGSRVTGIGCSSTLINVESRPPLAFKLQQVAFDTSTVTRVMSLRTDQLSRWVHRVLCQHPELASLLDDSGFATSR